VSVFRRLLASGYSDLTDRTFDGRRVGAAKLESGTMCDEDDRRCRAMALGLLCLAIAAALAHANLWGKSCENPNTSGAIPSIGLGSINAGPSSFDPNGCCGWPVIHTLWDWHVTVSAWVQRVTTSFECLLGDIFAAAVLVVSPLMVFRLRRRSGEMAWQFTLSGLFSLVTASIVLLSLFSLERAYGWTNLRNANAIGIYSALSDYPWYDIVPISLGIVCAIHLMLTALCQLLRAVLRRGRRGRDRQDSPTGL
jgi:hypothetical protein